MQRFSSIEEMCARISAKLTEPEPVEVHEDEAPARATTRFLNFRLGERAKGAPCGDEPVPHSAQTSDSDALAWLSIVEGAGCGHSFPLGATALQIGRGEDQDVQLSFGDTSISRKGHAAIAYYGSQRGFLLRDGRKPNPILLNGRALPEEAFLKNGDRIRIGETTLQFTLSDGADQA